MVLSSCGFSGSYHGIYLIPQSFPFSYFGVGNGLLFTMYAFGYALNDALYPKKGDLERLERLGLSIGLSITLVPLVGLMLNYAPWGIRLNPSFLSLTS